MKVFSVFGVSSSGKTTTIENITKELKRREFSVGIIKEVNSDASVSESGGSNTYDYRDIGSELVATRGCHGTDILFTEKLSVENMLRFFNQDYVVMEGIIDTETPKILCIDETGELPEEIDDTVFAISGIISKIKEYKGIPIINVVDDVKTLVDLIQEKVFEKLPGINCGKCGGDCRQMAADILKGNATRKDCKVTQESVEVYIDNKPMPLIPFVKDIVESVVKGVLSPLKGYKDGDITIKVRKR